MTKRNLGKSHLLEKEKIKEFFDIGYIIIPNLFSVAEVEKISGSLGRLYSMCGGLTEGRHKISGSEFVIFEGGRIEKAQWVGAAEPELLKIGEDPRLLCPASQILGSNTVEQLINQVHFKMPGDEVDFPWHQDSQHRRYGTSGWTDVNGRGSFVQSLMAIDKMTLENGPVCFYPGSLKKGHLELDEEENVKKHVSDSDMVPATLSPGSVAFFHPFTIHGSKANTSNVPRRVFVNGYASPGANHREYPGEGSCRTLNANCE